MLRKIVPFFSGCFSACVLVAWSSLAWGADPEIQFSRDIRPLLSNNCYQCHGPDEQSREADLRLDQEKDVLVARDGEPIVKPGDPAGSLLWQRITSKDADEHMPPLDSNKKLTAQDKALIKKWIEQGARWQGHWSFIPPTKPALPAVKKNGWARNPIDRFTLAQVESQGIEPSAAASRPMWLRRVTFDLLGLPPTIDEIDAFVADRSPDAFEKVVDRLLASPRFGERMAVSWLDLARYGDTSVYHADGPRDMWAWRNWVIRAYNTNKPFDEFTVEQLAGDLIPKATIAQKIATAFNRNHGTTDEGGVIPEEYRVQYNVDRVKTTFNVWLGLSMECCQCHEHKYDPISQKEYYQAYAYFNRSADKGMQTRNGNAEPKISVPKPNSKMQIEMLKLALTSLEQDKSKIVARGETAYQQWLAKANTKTVALPGDALAYFPMEKHSENEILDSIAKKIGHLKGKANWVAGKSGLALKLDGTNFVDLGNLADFERNEQFSYGGWIRPQGNASGAPLAKMDDGANYRGFDILFGGGKVSVHLVSTWPTDAIKVTTKKPIKANDWSHVFVTYDGSSKAKGVKIYVNGKSQALAVEQDGLKNSIRTSKPLHLGRRNPGAPFKGLLDEIRIYHRQLSDVEVTQLAGGDPIRSLLATAPEKRTPAQQKALRDHYFGKHDSDYIANGRKTAKLQQDIAQWSKPLTTVMIMADMPKPRKTYVLNRGNYASPVKSEEISPGVPAFLPSLPNGAQPNRMGLAKWIVDRGHPLTARVAVNRYWQTFFGSGIVETVADFGSQGAWPSHPALLDWMAVDFMDRGWDVKRTMRQIVLSATYQQTSRASKDLIRRDPRNRLLTRGPRFRLQGEFIRDTALATGGLLVGTIGGPSVKPYQPPGLWNEVSLGGNVRFKQDHGENLYRRSMYTYWKRSAPAPSMRIFDSPSRESCSLKRQRTNTPLQAFVTLNDPQFVEAARFFAERIMKEGGASPRDRIRFAYRVASGRLPSEPMVKILADAYAAELKVFQQDKDKTKALLAIGEGKRDEALDPAEHAAWTWLASVIFNLDATLTRG